MRMRKLLMLISSVRVKIGSNEGGPTTKINRKKLRNYLAFVLSP